MIDLRREPDELLLRVLLAADAPVAVIVRNNHADIVDERSQRALLDLVEPTATVRFHRSTPDSSTAIVTATPIEPSRRVASSQLAHVPRHRLAQQIEDGGRTPSPSRPPRHDRRLAQPGRRPSPIGCADGDRATPAGRVVITDTVPSPLLVT